MDDLIRNADTAMYAAKTAGKDRYEVFQPEMHERTVEFFEIQGVHTTIPLHRGILRDPEFLAGRLSTRFMERFRLGPA